MKATYDPEINHRRSMRLQGYDYSRPADYFVTICAKKRRCIFGDVQKDKVCLSELGKIVESCWNRIPIHYEHVRVNAHIVMPNHLHGIIEIRDGAVQKQTLRRGVQLNAPTKGRIEGATSVESNDPSYFSKISPKKGTLGVIVRTFKAAVTTIARQRGYDSDESIWQRNYYDHIIRSDVSHFFIAQYIEINPIIWAFDRDNPTEPRISIEDLSTILETQYNITGDRLASIIEQEADYKHWFETTEQE